MDLDQQSLTDKIKNFLATDSQFRNPKFDPAPFLIKILKQKQSDQEAILQRQKQLIQLQNEAFDLIDQICSEYSQDFLKLLTIPQKQGQQLQKLKSNMSVVKKKVKQTKSLLIATQKDLDQIYLNCMFNKIIYKKLKEVELKLYQYQSASLALKNSQFLSCSMNLPSFQGHSVLESALASKSQNLRLQLLSKGIEQVSLFLYLTPKIVLPSSRSLIERVSSQQSFFGNLKKHEGFHKKYNLFKKASCVEYLPSLWSFKQLQRKQGKIHLMYDIIQGMMNIGKIQQILESLQLDCRKSISSIFLLLQHFFSIDIQQQNIKKAETSRSIQSEQQTQNCWFLCKKNMSHITFISVVLDVIGVIIRKLIILRLILKQFQIPSQDLSNLQCYNFFELLLKQLAHLVENIYIKQEENDLDYIYEQIMKKIKSNQNYIYWGYVRNMLVRSLIIIDQNVAQIESEHGLEARKMVPRPKWQQILKIDQLDLKFYTKFHLSFMSTLDQIFNHQGRSFSFQSLQQICSSKYLQLNQVNFCRFFSSQQMKYSKQYIYTISLFAAIQRFFVDSNFNTVRSKKYQLFLLSVLYLKLNYYLQKFFINNRSLQRSYQLRKTNNKLKAKQKDFKREFDKIYVKKYTQISIKPWRKGMSEQVQPSKYRLIQNLKGIQKQNQMLLSYCVKNSKDIEKQKDSDNLNSLIQIYDKLQHANYDQNFSSKLIRIWDQIPQIETSIVQLNISLFQKLIELHMIIFNLVSESVLAKIYRKVYIHVYVTFIIFIKIKVTQRSS